MVFIRFPRNFDIVLRELKWNIINGLFVLVARCNIIPILTTQIHL